MGSKVSRHHSDGAGTLNRETIEELCQETGFSEQELLNWHTNFYKDCPDGKLTLKQFEHEYSKIMGKPTQKTNDYVKHMFNVYDEDKNQFIDFKEFVMALSAASTVNRLRLIETLFSVFDLDNDGKVTKEEMGKMLHTLADVIDSSQKHKHHHHHHHQQQYQNSDRYNSNKEINVEKRLDEAFSELNTNDDDYITKDEFIEWYIKTGLLSDVNTNEINVHDTSRIQKLDKKTRKIKQQHLSVKNHKNEENHHPQLARYMSHMTEQKPKSPTNDIDNDDDLTDDNATVRTRIHSEDTDSYYSKDNERWQHLFNSVLGQIRAQRAQAEAQQQHTDSPHSNQTSHFDSWKRQGEEKLKTEYYRQKSNEYTPDVVTIRL